MAYVTSPRWNPDSPLYHLCLSCQEDFVNIKNGYGGGLICLVKEPPAKDYIRESPSIKSRL